MGDRRTVSNLRRSASATSMRTPQHRPSYSTRPSRSPGNRTPLPVAGVTSNSEHNRRQAAENTAKVMDILQSHRAFLSRLNLGNVGLKSMTSNQLIEIISFFMMKIAGKNFLSKSRPNNHDDVILTFIHDLKYPFVVNKACFKSPNAHQFFPEVIAILAFLSDLMCDIKKCAASLEMPLKCCDRLLNNEFAQLFSAEALRNYTSYDPDHVSLMDNDSEARMIDRFIAIKIKNDKVTANELAVKAVKLRESNEKLQQNLIETDIQKCFASVNQQMIEKEQELQDLQAILNEKRTHLKMIMLKHEERDNAKAAKQAACDNLIEKIQNQQYTTLDIKQMMAKETTIKSSIALIQEETDAIKVQAADAQVKLARLQKLKLDKIKEFNEVTFGIVQKLMETPKFRQINVNDLTIDPTAIVQNVQKVCTHLHILNESCADIKRQYNQQIEQNREKLTACTAELKQVNEKYAVDMAGFQTASKKLNDMNQQCTNYKSDVLASANRMQLGISEQIVIKRKQIEEIDGFKMRVTSLNAENVELFNVGEQKALEIVRAKRAAIKQMDRLNDFIDDFFGDDNDVDGDDDQEMKEGDAGSTNRI